MKKAHLWARPSPGGWRLWLPIDAGWVTQDYGTWAEALAALDAWLGERL